MADTGTGSQRYKTSKRRLCEICGAEKNVKGFSSHLKACEARARKDEEHKKGERELALMRKRGTFLASMLCMVTNSSRAGRERGESISNMSRKKQRAGSFDDSGSECRLQDSLRVVTKRTPDIDLGDSGSSRLHMETELQEGRAHGKHLLFFSLELYSI